MGQEKAAAVDKTATALKFGHGSNAHEIRSFFQVSSDGLTEASLPDRHYAIPIGIN
jgi:hypothetical protein